MEQQKLEAIGEWWDVNDDTKKVSGKLTFTRKDGAILETKGALRGPDFGLDWKKSQHGSMVANVTQETESRASHYERILGTTKSDAVTLEECTRVRASGNPFEFKWEEIRSTWVLIGAHFEPGEKLEFDQFTVKLGNLTRWAGTTGLTEAPFGALKKMGQDIPEGMENVWYALFAIPAEDEKFKLSNGWEISLAQKLSKSGDRIHKTTLSQEFYFSAKHELLRPIEEIFELVSDLQDLITVSSTGASAVRELTLRRPDVLRGGSAARKDIKFYGQWSFPNAGSAQISDSKNSTYFMLPEFGGIEGVAKWLEATGRHRLKVSRALSGRYFTGMMVEDIILNTVSALESFDKTIKNDKVKDLKARLNRLQKMAGYPFSEMIRNPESWSKLVVQYRNESAHNLEKLVDSDSRRKFWISRSTYWLFVICMMREAELPESTFQTLNENQEFLYQSQRIREIDFA